MNTLRNRLFFPLYYLASKMSLSDLFLIIPFIGFMLYYPPFPSLMPAPTGTLIWIIIRILPLLFAFSFIIIFMYNKHFKVRPDRYSLSIILYVVLAFLSGFFMNDPNGEVLWYLEWWYMFSGVTFALLITMSFTPKHFGLMFKILTLVAIINCAFYVIGKVVDLGDDTLFADINILGRFIIVINNGLLLKLLSSNEQSVLKKSTIITIMLFIFATITLSLSRSSYLQYVITVGLIILLSGNKKLQIGSLIAGTVVVMLFGLMTLQRIKRDRMDVKNASDLGRISAMIAGYNMFKSSPIIGVGYSSHRNRYGNFQNKSQPGLENMNTIHNFYMTVLAETGIIGMGIYFYFNVYLMFILYKRYRIRKLNFATGFHELFSIMAIFTYQFNGLFFPLPNTEGYYWIFVAYALATYRGKLGTTDDYISQITTSATK